MNQVDHTYFPETLYFEDDCENSYCFTDKKPNQPHFIYHRTESDLLSPKYILSGEYGEISRFPDVLYAVYIEKDIIGNYFTL